MIQHLSARELGGVAARGASLEVNGPQFTSMELGGVASRLQPGAFLKVHNSKCFSSAEMGGIAARKPGHVVFA